MREGLPEMVAFELSPEHDNDILGKVFRAEGRADAKALR